MDFKGKVVVVTGASRGIGYHIADSFASCGATVVVCATQQLRCDQVADELAKKYGVSGKGIQVNVANFSETETMIKTVIELFGRLDILVNNAGITRDNLLLRMSETDWDAVLDTNLKSVFNTTKAAIRPMLKQKYGRIVNISSVVGQMGNPGQANYAASKAGMIGFSQSIAKEVGAKGITCNVVAPGFIDTDMIESLPKEYLDNIMSQIPLKRLGSTQDIANATLFLASDLASYITGQVLTVDGGMLM
ncbi:3-oxoacyl-ACP reductase FabG [bacterium]|nr:3-oxoacyl-ACP reductase FabG [bacterium]